MTGFISLALALIAYRLASLLVGLLFAFLGYKLFMLGVYEKAGELKAAWGDRNLTLKQAAPGTFFALFGAIVVGIALFRGVDFERLEIAAGKVTPPSQGQVVAPPFILVPAGTEISDEVKGAIERAVNGKPLSSDDRRKLGDWLKQEDQLKFEGFHALMPRQASPIGPAG